MFTVLPQLRRRLSSKRFLGRGHTDKQMQAEDTVRPQLRRRAARASIGDEAETGKPSSTRTGGCAMKRVLRTCALIIGLAFSIALSQGALAQKSGGVLKVT